MSDFKRLKPGFRPQRAPGESAWYLSLTDADPRSNVSVMLNDIEFARLERVNPRIHMYLTLLAGADTANRYWRVSGWSVDPLLAQFGVIDYRELVALVKRVRAEVRAEGLVRPGRRPGA